MAEAVVALLSPASSPPRWPLDAWQDALLAPAGPKRTWRWPPCCWPIAAFPNCCGGAIFSTWRAAPWRPSAPSSAGCWRRAPCQSRRSIPLAGPVPVPPADLESLAAALADRPGFAAIPDTAVALAFAARYAADFEAASGHTRRRGYRCGGRPGRASRAGSGQPPRGPTGSPAPPVRGSPLPAAARRRHGRSPGTPAAGRLVLRPGHGTPRARPFRGPLRPMKRPCSSPGRLRYGSGRRPGLRHRRPGAGPRIGRAGFARNARLALRPDARFPAGSAWAPATPQPRRRRAPRLPGGPRRPPVRGPPRLRLGRGKRATGPAIAIGRRVVSLSPKRRPAGRSRPRRSGGPAPRARIHADEDLLFLVCPRALPHPRPLGVARGIRRFAP